MINNKFKTDPHPILPLFLFILTSCGSDETPHAASNSASSDSSTTGTAAGGSISSAAADSTISTASTTISAVSTMTGFDSTAVSSTSGGAAGTSTMGVGGALGSNSSDGSDATSGAGGTMGSVGGGGTTTSTSGGGGTGGDGSEPSACATNRIDECSGTSPIECHFGGEPGDYLVTVELGGTREGDMYVEAESYRRMLGQVTTPAGQTQRFAFFVNVRQPEGQPIQDVPAGTPGLDLYIRGSAPAMSAVCYEKKPATPKLWIAGDSTVCDQTSTSYAGWGQQLPQFLKPPVSVANYADSGESSGSFLGSGSLWGAITQQWAAGDWVIIQFGHNDKNVTAAAFESNLEKMVTQAKEANVHPILVTPTSRVGYSLESEHINSTGANLPQIVRDLAAVEDVPVIDLTVTTWNWIQSIDWKEYFALGTDHTHTNPQGAEAIAGFVRDAIRDQQFGLEGYLR